jgi:GNAT superfamily N-acetyltransferase
MIVRQAKQEDIDSIIVLLQASLGESLLKKSAEIWNFKHVINYFGESTVLLAEEYSQILGVRAFMTWRWQMGNQVWNAYRAVDTSTHPNHQGKGIFKKLTLQALEVVKQKGDCFIFNTPNNQSRPGYLKMGWQEVGKIKVALVPTFFYAFHFLFSKKQVKSNITTLQLETLCYMHNQNLVAKNVLFTPKSPQYLKWRYEKNPLQDYIIHATPEFYVAMYIKKHRFFNELRIVETIGVEEVGNHKTLKNIIIKYTFQNKCWLITLADKNLFSLKIYGSFGPKLTFRPLTNSNVFIQKALQIRNWGYALGDLELF